MHLVISIFYNDVVFETVLKGLRSNNIPVFRWLELIEESVRGTDFEDLFEDFRKHTGDELWKDRKELEEFIQKPGTIERYTSGEMGFNLLYTFKAKALVEYTEDVADIVTVATHRLINEEIGENKDMLNFFDSAIQWDACRIKNIMLSVEEHVMGAIRHDMASFMADLKPKSPREYQYINPKNFSYLLTEEQKDYVRRNLSLFGNNSPGRGRLLSNAHTKKMLRTPVQIET